MRHVNCTVYKVHGINENVHCVQCAYYFRADQLILSAGHAPLFFASRQHSASLFRPSGPPSGSMLHRVIAAPLFWTSACRLGSIKLKKGWKVGAESDTLKSAEKLIFIAILPLYKMVNDFLRQIFVLMWLEFVPHFFARLSHEFVHSRHSALPNFFAIRQWCGVVEKGCSDLI